MTQQLPAALPLAPYRVLDLTDHRGYLCGRVLGDLGADVIKVEPPGGDLGRNVGPFYGDDPHPERSLYWFAYNYNKRGITLNLETSEGRDLFWKLVAGADFVVESFHPGYLESLALGYSALSQRHPRLILTSITPFGQSGPWRDYKDSDMVVSALSGVMYLSGDPDRPPVDFSCPQAYLQGALEAAIGTLIAHYYRETTGQGQHVDLSIQESLNWNTMSSRLFWEFDRVLLRRSGAARTWASAAARSHQVIWECQDGYVSYAIYGGKLGASSNRGIVAWMEQEVKVPELLKKIDWENYDLSHATAEEYQAFAQPTTEFFRRHTKKELYEKAIAQGIMFYPVSTIPDIWQDPQLKAREFWQEVEHPELGARITYPGAFIKMSLTPLAIRRRAPLIGEHNREVYGELGLSGEDLALLKQAGVV